jgi:type IV pilus assembly protein PilV
MNRRPSKFHKQSGIVLLESLIAILIFSLGILAIIGMQAMAVKQVSDAQYRSQAILLANQLLGKMSVSRLTPADLHAQYSSDIAVDDVVTGGPAYLAWSAGVESVMPGAADHPPTVNVSTTTGVVTITVYWLAPTDTNLASAHRYVMTGQIRNNT